MVVESLPQDPLFYGAALAAVIALTLHYMYYQTFIRENYRHIKWFRRLLLPHVSYMLRRVDEDVKNVDLSRLYVESPLRDSEHIMNFEWPDDKDYEYVLDNVEPVYFEKGLRPEVILASIKGGTEHEEVSNFILTGPGRRRTNKSVARSLYDIFLMLTSKYQLHPRLLLDEDEGVLKVGVHHELNPYNPLYSLRHLEGDEFSPHKGKDMFLEIFWEKFDEEIPEDIEFYRVYD